MRELLQGPAGAGKTRRVLEIIQDYLARGRGQNLLVLLPTASLVSHFKALLLAEGNLRGFVDRFLFTFHSLSYFWTAQKRNFTLARTHEKILLLEEILRQDCPSYFEGVKTYGGFRQSLINIFRELKEHRIPPAFFETQVPAFKGRWSGKSLDRFLALSKIYETYQKALNARGWWDDEDLLFTAATLIQEEPALLAGKELLILDGFYSFTPPEKALLEVLLKRIPQTLLTLTTASKPSELFEPVHQTLKNLAPCNFEPKLLEGQHRFAAPALKMVADGFLQDNPNSLPGESYPPPRGVAQGLQVWAAPDRQAEVEAIAQEILFLVHQAGYAFADIGIIFRQPRLYLDLFQEDFNFLNIPWRYWGKESLALHPWVKTALELGAMLSLGSLGWERERVFRVLKSGYFNLELSWVDELEQKAQNFSLNDEREWRKFLSGGKASPDKDMAPEGEDILGRLLDYSTQFQGKKSGPEWAPKCRGVLEEFLLAGAVRLASRQKQSLALLPVETFLATVEEVGQFGAQDKITFSEFHHVLTLAVNSVEIFLSDARKEAVNLIGVHEARQWELPVVFVVGLAEGEFPASGKEDLFIKDYQRKALQAGGKVNLPLSSTSQDEELLFYFAVTRPQRRLYLTYPTAGTQKKEMLPSTFLAEVKTLFSPEDWKEIFAALPSPWEPPRREKVHSPLALALYALGRKNEDSREGQGARWLLTYDSQYPWSRIKVLPVYQNHLKVPLESPTDKVYSISELETFAQCPLAYFYQYFLGLKPLELTYSEDQEPPFWGTLAHQILERHYRRSLPREKPPENEGFSSTFEEILAEHREPIPAGYLFLREQEFLKRNLIFFLEREKARNHVYPFHPQELEWSFGKGTKPLIIETKERLPIQLSGKIDRLDIGAPDKVQALVIDYKYSKQKKNLEKRIQAGLELQIPLYLLAAQELLGYKPVGGVLYYLKEAVEKPQSFADMKGIGQEGLWPKDFGPKRVSLYSQEQWQEMLQGTKERVGELVARIQQGDIRAMPENADYCGPQKCQFFDLCPTRGRGEKQG